MTMEQAMADAQKFIDDFGGRYFPDISLPTLEYDEIRSFADAHIRGFGAEWAIGYLSGYSGVRPDANGGRRDG